MSTRFLRSLFATVVAVASGTVACGRSAAAQPDASHVVAPNDATSTSPFEASTEDAAGGDAQAAPLPAGVLVSGQHTPIGIALDSANVYWMSLGTYSAQTGSYGGAQLMRCAKAGCGNAPTVLASGSWKSATRLVVSGSNVYWAAPNLLLGCAIPDCAGGPTVLWSGTLGPTDIAVGATAIYVGDSINNELLTCPVGGCGNPSVLWNSSVPPAAIGADGTTLYFGADGVSLLTCGPTGCIPVAVGGTPTAIDVSGSSVYVGTEAAGSPGAIASCKIADCPAGLKLISSNLTHCAGIAVDGADIYFTDWGATEVEGGPVPGGAGRVARCSLAGCNDAATPVAGFVNFPQQIAVDGTSVYWTDFGSSTDPHSSDDGRVMAVPR